MDIIVWLYFEENSIFLILFFVFYVVRHLRLLYTKRNCSIMSPSHFTHIIQMRLSFHQNIAKSWLKFRFGHPVVVRLRRRRQSVSNLPPPIQRYSYVATVYSSRIAAFSIRVGLFTLTWISNCKNADLSYVLSIWLQAGLDTLIISSATCLVLLSLVLHQKCTRGHFSKSGSAAAF
jgi:hypothetical protein